MTCIEKIGKEKRVGNLANGVGYAATSRAFGTFVLQGSERMGLKFARYYPALLPLTWPGSYN
jgi:hypothetical protein